MTRILHVTDCYLPQLGGIEMHVHDLVRRQREAGHDASVLTSTPRPADDPPDPDWVRRVEVDAASSTVRSVVAAAGMSALLERARPEVVHVHVSVLSPFASAAARQAARRGVPAVITVHSLWSALGVLPGVADAVLGLRGWPVLWSAVSSRATEPLQAMLGPQVPVVVLPNAVDPADWVVPHEPGTPATLVSVMRVARRKRPLPLARILRRVRATLPDEVPLRAVIIGDGPQRTALQHYLDRHAMSSWVRLPGRLERPAIRQEYGSGTCYLAPAVLESFGIAALEARCAGLPVIASSHGGVGEFITDGVDGVLAPSDAALEAAIVRMLTDQPFRDALTTRARTVTPAFDWRNAHECALAAYARAADIAAARHRTTPGWARRPAAVEGGLR